MRGKAKIKGGRTSGKLLPECEGKPECQKPPDCKPLWTKYQVYPMNKAKNKREYDECVAKERASLNCPDECFEKKGLSKGKRDMLKVTEGLNKVTSTATAGILAVGKPALAAAASSVGGPAAGLAVNEAYNKMVEQPGYADDLKEKSVFGNDERVWDVVNRAGNAAVKVGEKTAARMDQIDPEKEGKELLDKALEEGKKEGSKRINQQKDRFVQEAQRRVDDTAQMLESKYQQTAQAAEDEITRRSEQFQRQADSAQNYVDSYLNTAQNYVDSSVNSLNNAMAQFETYYTDDGDAYYYNPATGVSQWELPQYGGALRHSGFRFRSGNRFAR